MTYKKPPRYFTEDTPEPPAIEVTNYYGQAAWLVIIAAITGVVVFLAEHLIG